MLPKTRKIPAQEFSAQKKDINIATSYFSARARKSNRPDNRFGVVVSTKVAKKAHIRNTLKRRAFSFVEGWEDRGVDMVIYLLPQSAKLSRNDFYKELDVLKNKLFAKLNT